MIKHAVHEMTGILTQLKPDSGTRVTFLGGTIAALARLADYFSTAVTSFSDDGSDKAGSHCQSPYHGSFPSLLPNT